MGKLKALLYALGIGAGAMYFYDPTRGTTRRTRVRDWASGLRSQADESIDIAVRDLRNRTRGVLAEAMGRLSDEEPSDWLVTERVRSQLGHLVSYPGAIQVGINEGRIILGGHILAADVDRLLKGVSLVRGVHGIDNQLEVHPEAGDVAALQGPGRMRSMVNGQNGHSEWSPSTRLLTGLGGSLLAIYGGMRRGIIGSTLSVVGLGLAARGVTNLDLKSLFGMSTATDVIRLNKTINLNAPVEELYRFWTKLENLPRFMSYLKEVKDMGNGRSHWVAKGPAGVDVEWDAVTTREVPNEMIAWESVAGSPVKTSGSVQFQGGPSGGTRLVVNLNYTPPAGALGHAVASLFGSNPKQAMDEDLARLKGLFETGKTHVDGEMLSRQDLSGASGF